MFFRCVFVGVFFFVPRVWFSILATEMGDGSYSIYRDYTGMASFIFLK